MEMVRIHDDQDRQAPEPLLLTTNGFGRRGSSISPIRAPKFHFPNEPQPRSAKRVVPAYENRAMQQKTEDEVDKENMDVNITTPKGISFIAESGKDLLRWKQQLQQRMQSERAKQQVAEQETLEF